MRNRISKVIPAFLKNKLKIFLHKKLSKKDSLIENKINSGDLFFNSAKNPVVSLVVPFYNHFSLTLRCLKKVMDSNCQYSFEVIVVDDWSTDYASRGGGYHDSTD